MNKITRMTTSAMRLGFALQAKQWKLPMFSAHATPIRHIYERSSGNPPPADEKMEKMKDLIHKPVGHVEKTGTTFPHLVYSEAELKTLNLKLHHNPSGLSDKFAYWSVQFLRKSSDLLMGDRPSPRAYLNRFIYLETVAAVPGMVAGCVRHLNSLRQMKEDKGWIHSLLEEAENERMHLVTWMEYRQPSKLMRASVVVGQGLFFNVYFLLYLLSPKTAHRFVGYLEEEAVKTYSHFIQAYDAGDLKELDQLKAPKVAQEYWKLPESATIRDVALVIRADEAAHRDVNHTLSNIPQDSQNPFE